MSQENVDLIRCIYDAGNQGDWTGAFRGTAPQFEVTFKTAPKPGTHRGREAAQAVGFATPEGALQTAGLRE